MPGLHTLTGDFEVAGEVKIRPVDLYATSGHRQAGLVLVGDAFSTSCPAAGTGARKAINDVERLCNVHIPRWLATPGMDASKIAGFYEDPVKRACDEASLAKAFDLRAFSLDPSWPWQTRRRVEIPRPIRRRRAASAAPKVYSAAARSAGHSGSHPHITAAPQAAG